MMRWRDLLFLVRHALPRLPRLLARRRRLVKRYGSQIFPHSHIFPCIGGENVVYTSQEFQPETTFIDDSFHFVGPSLDAGTREAVSFPWERLDGERPIVYVSLGTIHSNAAFFETVFAACAGLNAQVVVSTGRTDRDALAEPPPNFLLRPFVPQLELLQRADLFVSHGGMNSVNESLHAGTPLVVVPQQLEQVLNGRQVARHGAGLVVGDTPPYGRAGAEQLRDAVDQVLASADYRENAARLGQSFREAGGYLAAVKILEARAARA